MIFIGRQLDRLPIHKTPYPLAMSIIPMFFQSSIIMWIIVYYIMLQILNASQKKYAIFYPNILELFTEFLNYMFGMYVILESHQQ